MLLPVNEEFNSSGSLIHPQESIPVEREALGLNFREEKKRRAQTENANESAGSLAGHYRRGAARCQIKHGPCGEAVL